ncbi:MAG TPA: diaminopimelate epimerase [Gemmatimonadaceae bacterium]|nr:diaminopimelate epimerase [Gemmatimonadaceae bacterium]
MIKTGRPFLKMSGSGNDFVFVDARSEPPGELEKSATIQAVCARGSGVGADGIVFLREDDGADLRIRYLNSDGSLAALCGNATLCATRLAAELGIVGRDRDFTIATDSGPVTARFRDGLPEIDLQPVTELSECFDAEPDDGEFRIGFALVGVPHLVVSCRDVERAPVVERGRQLRHHAKLTYGANVNFVSRAGPGRWRIRTYERGVEAETLACGTGAVASALMLATWGEATDRAELETKSGRVLRVRHRREGGKLYPSLSGEARIVYRGQLAELFSTTV